MFISKYANCYNIRYNVGETIFVNTFSINHLYRGKKLSYKIFNELQLYYKKDIVLECYPTLLPFYKKLGFEVICETNLGYLEIIKPFVP